MIFNHILFLLLQLVFFFLNLPYSQSYETIPIDNYLLEVMHIILKLYN